MASGGGSNESANWNREWREQVSHELESSAEKHAATAVIQERILGVLNAHDIRLLALEKRPDTLRANLTSFGGCSSELVFAAFYTLNLAVGIAALLIALFHGH